jgi:2-C-methyl-D-erythritol 4-phosphate cytidylyltransferase
VLGGLRSLQEQGVDPTDWVLVHDAARCLITPRLIQALLAACANDSVGGLLALPLPDTLKASVDGRVSATLNRSDKWLAQTPQMFRFGLLRHALRFALKVNFLNTLVLLYGQCCIWYKKPSFKHTILL